MSLQNLKKENNYELYCNKLNVDEVAVNTLDVNIIDAQSGIFESVTTSELVADPGTDMVIYNNLVTVGDLAASLGKGGKGFSNLFCQNLCGLGGPVNVQTSINGPLVPGPNPGDPPVISNLIITSPVGITGPGTDPVGLYNGLKFTNVAPIAPITSYNLERYEEYSGQLTAQGAIPVTQVNYKAVIIGNIVTLKIQSFIATCNNTGVPITIVGLPSLLKPNNNIVFSVEVNVNNTNNENGVLIIQSSGSMLLQPDTRGTFFFTNALDAGFYSPTPESDYWYSYTYNLN